MRRWGWWAAKYLSLRHFLHGMACRKAWLTKENHTHTWLVWRRGGRKVWISARYEYDQ